MTLDELTFLIERLAEAGCSAEQLVAAAKAARDWRIERRAYQAVKRALAPAAVPDTAPESGFPAANADTESDFPAQQAGRLEVGSEAAEGQSDLSTSSRKAKARKGLLTTRRLRPCARQVGAVLVERYNLKSGRCDASVQRLADDAGYDIRSARRAIGQLERAGLFTRAPAVGRGHTNGYVPQWPALEALATEVEQATGVAADRGGKADSENRTPGGKPDGRVRQNRKSLTTTSIGASGQLGLRIFSPIEGDGAALKAKQHKALVAAEMALRGKYARDSRLGVLVAGFHALDGADQGLIAEAEIAERGGGLRTFERMLRERAPPQARGAG